MRRLILLALIVPAFAGCGGSSSSSPPGDGGPAVPVPHWITVERLPPNAVAGAKLFAGGGCRSCHTYAGSGKSLLGAPDLTAIGARHLGVAFEIAHLTCPSCTNPGSPMPGYRSLGAKRLRQLAIFLEHSKGIH